MRQVAIVIPMRNERAAVRPLMTKLRSALDSFIGEYRIIVVDGFSTDGTPDTVRRYSDGLPLELVELSVNEGLGGALNVGLRAALDRADTVVTMDGDDSHDPSTIPLMLEKLEEGFDAVVASRFQPGGGEIGVAAHRRLLSHMESGLLRRLFPMGMVRDYSSGFRAYRPAALRRIQDAAGRIVTESGFACTMELLLKLRASGASVAEVPLVLRYDLKRSESKMAVGSTAIRYLTVIGRNFVNGSDPQETRRAG